MRIEGIRSVKNNTPFPRPCTINDGEYRYLEGIVLARGRRVHTYERRILIRNRRLRRLERNPVSIDRAAYVLFLDPFSVAEFVRTGRMKARRATGRWKWMVDPSEIRRLAAALDLEDESKDRLGMDRWIQDFTEHVRGKYGELSAQKLYEGLREKVEKSRAEVTR